MVRALGSVAECLNLRELGGTKSGGRNLEALLYLAEIISHFDLIAVQEVRDNLERSNSSSSP